MTDTPTLPDSVLLALEQMAALEAQVVRPRPAPPAEAVETPTPPGTEP